MNEQGLCGLWVLGPLCNVQIGPKQGLGASGLCIEAIEAFAEILVSHPRNQGLKQPFSFRCSDKVTMKKGHKN